MVESTRGIRTLVVVFELLEEMMFAKVASIDKIKSIYMAVVVVFF